jgi:hypothetical protein
LALPGTIVPARGLPPLRSSERLSTLAATSLKVESQTKKGDPKIALH